MGLPTPEFFRKIEFQKICQVEPFLTGRKLGNLQVCPELSVILEVMNGKAVEPQSYKSSGLSALGFIGGPCKNTILNGFLQSQILKVLSRGPGNPCHKNPPESVCIDLIFCTDGLAENEEAA